MTKNNIGKTPTYIDITKDVRRVIEESGIQNGICAVISPHTTCSVFFEEFCHDYNEDGIEQHCLMAMHI